MQSSVPFGEANRSDLERVAALRRADEVRLLVRGEPGPKEALEECQAICLQAVLELDDERVVHAPFGISSVGLRPYSSFGISRVMAGL